MSASARVPSPARAERRAIRSLLLAALVFGFALPASSFADTPLSGKWWIEIVRERPLPTAVAEARAEAEKAKAEAEKIAAEKEAKEAKEAEEAAPEGEEVDDAAKDAVAPEAAEKAPIKERVKEMLDKIPALPEDAPADEEAAAEDKPAAAKDDAEDKDDEAKEDAADAEEAVKPDVPAAPETLSLTVAMAGEVIGLNDKELIFRPSFSPEKELRLPIKQVTSLSRHAPGKKPDGEEPPDLEFRVVLRDGSEVPGQLVSLTDKAITVALVGSGARIDLPLGQITRVERNKPIGEAANGPMLDASDRHVAALSTGEIVAGQLLPSRDSEKWLRISSPILTAEAPLSLIDLLIFPDPLAAPAGGAEEALADDALDEVDEGNNAEVPELADDLPPAEEPAAETEAEEEAEEEVHHIVSLSPAGMLWAKNLKLEGDNLLISALGKDGFAVPMARVESVSFGHEGLGATAPILVWGGYADEDDEYKKTLDALSGRIPARKLLQSMSKTPDADFMRQLRRSRVLLVPEMESFRKEELEEAAGKAGRGVPSWGEAFKGFLRRGGNIIFLSPTGDALTFFNDSGLGPLRSGGSGDGWKFTDVGRKLGAKIDGTVENVNATHYYRKAAPWETWGEATDGDEGVTLVGRRLERGWVMAFGADFYETNEDVTETLVRLLEFRGRK